MRLCMLPNNLHGRVRPSTMHAAGFVILFICSCLVAAALVAGAFLSATIQTIAEKLSSMEFRGFISNTKFNYLLLEKFKTTLFTLQAAGGCRTETVQRSSCQTMA
ncbi:putative disease resistance RPP13 protein [Trifolium repens]|nr:putative disease resistance RPP13 protein [Trifolium repens]